MCLRKMDYSLVSLSVFDVLLADASSFELIDRSNCGTPSMRRLRKALEVIMISSREKCDIGRGIESETVSSTVAIRAQI